MTKTTPKMPTLADDFRQMMSAWDTIRAAARREFPGASEVQIDAYTRQAFESALGLKATS